VKVVHVHRMRGIGGSERHLLALLPALADRGAGVAFVGLDDPDWDVAPFYDALGLPARRLRSARDLDPALPLRLRRTLEQLRPNVVHTHLVHADVYGALASPRAPWRIVSTKHNDDPFRAGAFRFVERALTKRTSRVIAITHALRRFCVERVGLPEAKVDVVHYGLDEVPAWREHDTRPPKGRFALVVGRLVEQKGVDVAVRALAAFPDDVRLAVLGDGPERPRLETLARESGVADRVLLPGRVGDVAAWLRAAELVLHPVRWEGFGLAVLEAMLAERPVVASAVSAVPELVVDGETGLLVPPGDAEALAAAAAELLADPDRGARMGAAGLHRARTEFSVARMADSTLEVYERALGSSER
jgi:glycosyltransferase involved in cell wall biosynthesis